MRCYHAYGMQVCHIIFHALFPILGMKFFIHHVNTSTSVHQHKIFTHCMLFNYQEITHKRSLNWDFNPTRHHPVSTFKTRNKTKLFYFFFFLEIVSLSQKRTPVASESLYHNKDSRRNSYVTPGAWSHAPKLLVERVACAACVSCVLCKQPVWPPGWVTTQ